jgi:hypothetical protein
VPRRLQDSRTWACPASYLRQERGGASGQALDIGEKLSDFCASCVLKPRMRLMGGQRFCKEAQRFTMPRIQAFPKALLFSSIPAEPLFGAARGASRGWFGWFFATSCSWVEVH